MIEESACIGCGLCAKVCPFDAISIFDREIRRILFEPAKCGECEYECNGICPVHAIEEKPDRVAFTFEYAPCMECGRKLDRTVEEADYLAKKLKEAGEEGELAYLCDECKRRRIFDVAIKYEGYLG